MGAFWIWVDWSRELVALCPAPGFEGLPFLSRERQAANVRLLLQEGFHMVRP